jgi:hypothetical protein
MERERLQSAAVSSALPTDRRTEWAVILRTIRFISAMVIGFAVNLPLVRWMTPDAGGWALIDKRRTDPQTFQCDFLSNEIVDAMRGIRFDTWLHSPQMWHGVGVMVAVALLVYSGVVLLESHPAGLTN